MSLPEIHLFGATTFLGQAFINVCRSSSDIPDVFCYSRANSDPDCHLNFVDLDNPLHFAPAGKPGHPMIWISFAPIWKFAPFLHHLATHFPERLVGLSGLILCSSSSVITKRFAVNQFDRRLVASLANSEKLVVDSCRCLNIPCHILEPSIIYGRIGKYCDRNLSVLLKLLRLLPFIVLPSKTGLRQPIHAHQLASVVLSLVSQLFATQSPVFSYNCTALGGDTTLSYYEMVCALQRAQLSGDPALHCFIIQLPSRFFYLLCSPFLLISPKIFEALFRIGSDLSGFTPAHKILASEPQSFPLAPLA